MSLKARKTLDNSVMILDHNDIDIVYVPEKSKIVTFAKENFGDHVYEAQYRFFKFMRRKGIIQYDSVKGGNIYSSMEADVLESKDYNSTQMTLLAIGKFIENERPYIEYEKAFEREEERRLSEPSPEESTELDTDKYHSVDKGSIKPGISPYA